MHKIPRSWKTTLAGLFVVASAILPVVGVPAAICTAVGSIAAGLGLVVAKDHNVSGKAQK
jgi:hypothetical protein